MLTLKQLETFVAIVDLGTFEAAANDLSTTQSAVSKRIHELELACAAPLFDRRLRKTQLTPQGHAALAIAREMLDRRSHFLEQVNSQAMMTRRFRFGVTELSSVTWLAKYVDAIHMTYPNVSVEPEVSNSAELCERLAKGAIEMAVVPEAASRPEFAHTPLPRLIEHAWMCAPKFHVKEDPLPLAHLGSYPVLLQSRSVATDVVFGRWLEHYDVQIRQIVPTNNLLAMLSLAMSGIAIAYLPFRLCAPLLAQGALRPLRVRPALPKVRYVEMHVARRRTSFTGEMIRLARRHVNFDSSFLLGSHPGQIKSLDA